MKEHIKCGICENNMKIIKTKIFNPEDKEQYLIDYKFLCKNCTDIQGKQIIFTLKVID